MNAPMKSTEAEQRIELCRAQLLSERNFLLYGVFFFRHCACNEILQKIEIQKFLINLYRHKIDLSTVLCSFAFFNRLAACSTY